MRLVSVRGQALRFGIVGGLATLAHGTTALTVASRLGWAPERANLAGYLVAVFLSYGGHTWFTFGARGGHRQRLPSFLAISLMGSLASAAITRLVCGVLGGSLTTAMVAVMTTVPALTFVASRRWAFAPDRPRPGSGDLIREPALRHGDVR